ncbi:MAG TPA: hypothetical protein VK025_08115 [Steroidobacter sp.]|jgi:hypothetical protein|nr:hypothetical protein [Steroidobacteraceae bacterium]HLS81352.1 hypothetical protein [Steroidobacter sp.]
MSKQSRISPRRTARPPFPAGVNPADARSSADSERWSRRRQDLGALLWSSFLAACLATMVFFACFDPVLLADDHAPPKWLADRMTGYALGFFFFWGVCTIASLLTTYLIDTRSSERHEP